MIKRFLSKIFKRHSPSKEMMSEYVERDTECDDCEFLFSCEDCIETTTRHDTRRHYVRGIGAKCRKERVIDALCNIGNVNIMDSASIRAVLKKKEERDD